MNELLENGTLPAVHPHPNQLSELKFSQRPLRIVHIVSSMKVGGMEQFVLRLAEAQQQRGHKAGAIALQGGPLLETALKSGVSVKVLGGKLALTRVIRAVLALANLRPDIIHAHNPTSLHYAILGKLVGRAPVIMTDHAQTKGIQRVVSRREQRLTDAVVAVSKDTAAKSSVRGQMIPLSVIHNGIDLTAGVSDRTGMRAALGLKDVCVGIMVASMEKVKRHEDLLLALALLMKESFPVTMLVAGDGPERSALETMARRLQLGSEQVRFLGLRSDVTNLLAASDFFVLPSQMEGLPLSILEAMKQRLPVIATPVGGVPEIISHGRNGLLTPGNDPEALAQCIRQLADDPQLRASLGQAGYDRVCSDFDFAEMTTRYLDLYDRISEKTGRIR